MNSFVIVPGSDLKRVISVDFWNGFSPHRDLNSIKILNYENSLLVLLIKMSIKLVYLLDLNSSWRWDKNYCLCIQLMLSSARLSCFFTGLLGYFVLSPITVCLQDYLHHLTNGLYINDSPKNKPNKPLPYSMKKMTKLQEDCITYLIDADASQCKQGRMIMMINGSQSPYNKFYIFHLFAAVAAHICDLHPYKFVNFHVTQAGMALLSGAQPLI